MNSKETNLFIALGQFIQAMRLFISTELKRDYGESWDRKYFEKLLPQLQEAWGKSLQQGISPEYLIDFGNLNSFAIGAKKDFFYEFFDRKSNNLPTIFNELAEVRNMAAHYLPIDDDKAEKAYLHMIELAKDLEMNELEMSLRKLKNDSFRLTQGPTVAARRRVRANTVTNKEGHPKKLMKSDAIGMVNDAIGENQLSNGNTVFSNINKTAPCWWFNISPSKFKGPLNILMADTEELIWIHLPPESCVPPEDYFNTRNDNGKIDLRIGIDGIDYLKDQLNPNNFDFKPYIKRRLSI